jgi:hypothetical protein
LTALLAGAPLCSPYLHAGILPTFTAGDVTVGPGGSVSMPITVQNFQGVAGVQFSLTWDSGLLTLQPTPVVGLDSAVSGGTFGPGTGSLTWVWVNFSGANVENGAAIFSVQFTAGNTLGIVPVSFGNSPTDWALLLTDNTYADGTPDYPFPPLTFNNGSVSVIPEPINCALGLFACVFIGTGTVRWLSSRRMALQSAGTVSRAEPGCSKV